MNLFFCAYFSVIFIANCTPIHEFIPNKSNLKVGNNNDDDPSSGLVGTNLSTSIIYCIKERSGKFLGWNGKNDYFNRVYGLSLRSDIECPGDKAYYYELIDEKNYVRLKNRETGNYLSFYSGNYCLANNRILDTNMKLVVQPDGGWINIRNAGNDTIFMSAKNVIKDGVYMNYGTKNFWEIGYWEFIPTCNKTNEVTANNSNEAQCITFTVEIHSFDYEIPDESTVKNKTIRVSLLSTTLINNSSRVTINHEISNQQSMKDSLKWIFNENFENFSKIVINKELPSIITEKSGFNDIDINYNTDDSNKFTYSTNKIYNYGCIYSFKRSISLPPKSAVDVKAFVDKVIDLEINFVAEAEISAKKINIDLSGEEIASIYNITSPDSSVISINQKSITISINGILVSTFGLKSFFDVIDV